MTASQSSRHAVTRLSPHAGGGCAARLVEEGRELSRLGHVESAVQAFQRAIELAEAGGEAHTLAEALRRLAVLHQLRHETEVAAQLCRRSHDVAAAAGDAMGVAEALNSLGIFALEAGEFAAAHDQFSRAAQVGTAAPALLGRVEQNLGILANIRGDLNAAFAHYERSLHAFESAGDDRGRALAYNNLGLASADLERWDDADRYYRQCWEIASAIDDVYLRGLALMNHTEVFLARQRFEDARENADQALAIFTALGALRHQSETHKILGVVYRETGRPTLAEGRLRAAVDLAVQGSALLEEAEARRELALLYQQLNRNQDALRLLGSAHKLFQRLDARRDMVDVGGKMADLEGTYLKVVREWGRSIESADSYTHGHSERVATYAVAVARQLGLADDEITTVRLGAYLHDVGKVRVPVEILNKPGKLTESEFAVMRQHPVYGVELLEGIEFPWDIKPIIRWHHEKHDGTGYPDRLCGEQIPLHAQIICVADVYDALTTTRSYRPALAPERALGIMRAERASWRPDVFAAFEATLGGQ